MPRASTIWAFGPQYTEWAKLDVLGPSIDHAATIALRLAEAKPAGIELRITPRRPTDHMQMRAKFFIKDYLAKGPKLSRELFADALKAGYSAPTIRLVFRTLGVIAGRMHGSNGWLMHLPSQDQSESFLIVHRSRGRSQSITLPDWATAECATVREWLTLYG